MSNFLAGKKYKDRPEVIDAINTFFQSKNSSNFYHEGIFSLPKRW